MNPDEQYRAFLLGIADADIQKVIEEGLLDGSIYPAHLQQVEEELIDDHLFGRLSGEEESAFRSEFLVSSERVGRLKFARALKSYAGRHALAPTRAGAFLRLRQWAAAPWLLPLLGALSCAVMAILWLGERNSHLNDQLTQAADANSHSRREIESLLEEQRRNAAQPARPVEQAELRPVVRLSPGVTRGLAVIPVLHLGPHDGVVEIVLTLPFNPAGNLREELQDSAGQTIWKQEFSVTSGLSANGTASIVLPAGLLATGEYQLLASDGPHGEEASYLLRVRKD